MDPRKSGELFWQAFRYASDEMPPAEREAFDNVLAADQSAREAVARVVELEGLVSAAETAPAPERPAVMPLRSNNWLEPVGWVALGAAACLAAVMAFQAFAPPASQNPPGLASPGQVAIDRQRPGAADGKTAGGELALAWARAQLELPAPEDTAAESADHAAEQDLASAGTEQVDMAPSWLLAAVADSQSMSDEN